MIRALGPLSNIKGDPLLVLHTRWIPLSFRSQPHQNVTTYNQILWPWRQNRTDESDDETGLQVKSPLIHQ